MNKNRLENFSDGVFSIAVTLLILNVKIPGTRGIGNNQLNQELRIAIPHLITFVFSFLVIGVFWVAHHRIFSFVRVLDNTLLWLNILYLMFVAITPLSFAILSENPFLRTAILFYTTTLLLISVMHFFLLAYILRHKDLKHKALTRDIYRSAQKTAIVGPVCYIGAAAASWINPYISFSLIICAMLFYIFFSAKAKMEQRMLIAAKREADQ